MPWSRGCACRRAELIRRAERRDCEALGRLGAMLVRTHYAFDAKRFLAPTEGTEAGYAAFLGRMLDSPDACVFVSEENGKIEGYVFAALEPLSWEALRGPAGFIHDIAVAEEARRRGIATGLMRAAIEWLREHGAPRVLLGAAASNAGAQRLFHRLGFRDTMIEMTMELGK
jgi:ribosomal protein S18 acetylase RimI-like enzyme